ncbi:MAG: shikimate dehydrogenase [Lachnospiraceae bacterium]|jgi:shikimate dehydrogenase|nr:shikimate dehydrogenase [Lachnospiraceae bacterium]
MREVDGRSRVCGLLANPIEHTLSPFIHNHLTEKLGIDMVYVPFKVGQEGIKMAVQGAYALNILGLNVSVPYKEKVMDSLLEIDENAKKIGAVNTLVRIEEGYKGYNTDYLGLKKALESDGFFIKGKEVIVLGAGGAAKAVLHLCGLEEVKRVYVLNRTEERAKKVAQETNKNFQREFVIPMKCEEYKKLPQKEYLAIQTTSVGMYPNIEQAIIEEEDFYQKLSGAYDIVFNPTETKFMKNAKKANVKTANGLKMLLYQAIIAFELWTEQKVKEEIAEWVYNLLEEEFIKK